MDDYLTYCAGRRIQWRDHDSRKKVRASIRASGRYGLRIWQRIEGDLYGDAFVEIRPEMWDDIFGEA